MAPVLSPLTAKTADATPLSKSVVYYDLSGTGAGPFVPATMQVDASGNPITLANAAYVQDSTVAGALATLHTDLATIAGDEGALGSQADTAWIGTGNGSIVAVLKAAWSKLSAIAASVAGTLTVQISGNPVLGAGAATIGNVGLNASAGTGWTPGFVAALTGKLIKTGAGKLSLINCSNPNATAIYLLLYDGTDSTGTLVQSIDCPPGLVGGFTLSGGLQFNTGIYAVASTVPGSVTAPATAPTLNYAFN